MDDMQSLLETTGAPVALLRFLPGSKISPPFIIWFDQVEKRGSDHKNLYQSRQMTIELYAITLDLRLERRIETILDNLGVHYSKERVWISSEKMYETIYEYQKEEKL